MEQDPQKICIILGGSFFPLHEGHIDLLIAAKQYYKKLGFDVVKCLVCPSHFGSLSKKFVKLSPSDDNRIETIRETLKCYDWVECYFELIESKTNVGFSVVIQKLTDDLASLNVKVVQICGTDSKINFTKHSQNVLVVRDNRPIPQHNKTILKNATVTNTIKDKPVISSTILRYIHKTMYPQCTLSDFSLDWLTSTGIVMGRGRQGCVYLMLLGRYEVAVKIYVLFSEEDKVLFENETSILETISHDAPKIYPNVHYCGIVGGHFDESIIGFGIIVTDVCIPLQKIFSIVHKYWEFTETEKSDAVKEKDTKTQDLIKSFVDTFKFFEVKFQDTTMNKKIQTIEEMKSTNKNKLKLEIMGGFAPCLEKLKSMSIIHRDLAYDNIAIDIRNSSISTMFIDFGVAKRCDFDLKIRRGSLRYYPVSAVNEHIYDFFCDEYMVTFVMYEIINEHEIYPECNGDTRKIIKNRKKNIHPSWGTVDECFNEVINYIGQIWKN